MRPLLALSHAIDLLNEKIGYICNWLVLAACNVSAGNAMIRYAFGYSSNGWLELQWYMFAVLVITAPTSLMVMASPGHDPAPPREHPLRRTLPQTRALLVCSLAAPSLAPHTPDPARRLRQWRL